MDPKRLGQRVLISHRKRLDRLPSVPPRAPGLDSFMILKIWDGGFRSRARRTKMDRVGSRKALTALGEVDLDLPREAEEGLADRKYHFWSTHSFTEVPATRLGTLARLPTSKWSRTACG